MPDQHFQDDDGHAGATPAQQQQQQTGAPGHPGIAVTLTRYGLPAVIVLAGVIAALAIPGQGGVVVLVGLSGVSACVVLFNVLLQLGASGDRDRDREAAAREFYDQHGRWPDDRRRGSRSG